MILEHLIEFLIDRAKSEILTKSVPKSKAARTFFRLYISMKDCHEEWLHLQQLGVDNLCFSDTAAYIKSVDNLTNAFSKVKDHLKIFDYNTYEVIREYGVSEMGLSEKLYNDLMVEKFGREVDEGRIIPRFQLLRDSVNQVLIETIQFEQSELARSIEDNSSYKKSSELLAKFIKKNFELEDLF